MTMVIGGAVAVPGAVTVGRFMVETAVWGGLPAERSEVALILGVAVMGHMAGVEGCRRQGDEDYRVHGRVLYSGIGYAEKCGWVKVRLHLCMGAGDGVSICIGVCVCLLLTMCVDL